MGWIQDLIDEIEDFLQDKFDDLVEIVLKILISGYTLVMSSVPIGLLSFVNDRLGYVDPLTYQPKPCYPTSMCNAFYDGRAYREPLEPVSIDRCIDYGITGDKPCTKMHMCADIEGAIAEACTSVRMCLILQS